MKKLFTILSLIPMLCFAQHSDDSLTNQKNPRPTYYIVSMGMERSVFRDFATSPLFYNGYSLFMDAGRYRSDNFRTTDFRMSYASGIFNTSVGDHESSSNVYTLGLYYSNLYGLVHNKGWEIKVGGMVDNTGILRINESLQNNALGLDLFINFCGSALITRDISRKEAKDFKFWFIKYQFKPRKRELSFKVNLGLMNSHFRNGYAYTGQSAILNEPQLADGYKYTILSGFRLSTSLEYRHYLLNKNAIALTYYWDAYKTGGEYDTFEMASHILKFSLFFNTK